MTKATIKTVFLGIFFSWFIYTDHMERGFRRDEIFYMRDMVREAHNRHNREVPQPQSTVLTELLQAAGARSLNGPARLAVCLAARRTVDTVMQEALERGDGFVSDVELWSIHDDSIAEFCRQAILNRTDFESF